MNALIITAIRISAGTAFVAVPALSFAEEPRESLAGLGSESFRERSAAEERLGRWAGENGERAKDWLATSMDATADPEVKRRLRKVLKGVVVEDEIASGPGYVGIQMAPAQIMLPGEKRLRGGVSVQFVVPGTPGERAGLRPGDTIVSLEGRKWSVEKAIDGFREAVSERRPGARVKLGVLRDGKVLTVEVELAPKPLALPELALGAMFGMAREAPDMTEAEERAREELFKAWLGNWRARQPEVRR